MTNKTILLIALIVAIGIPLAYYAGWRAHARQQPPAPRVYFHDGMTREVL